MSKTVKRARDARSGQYVTLQEAKKRPATTVVETQKAKRR